MFRSLGRHICKRVVGSSFRRQIWMVANRNSKLMLSSTKDRLSSVNTLNGFRTFSSDPEAISFEVQDYDDFQERVIHSDTPVVVQFHATWCGPCKMLSPRLESAVGNRDGKLLLAKVDIDDLQDLAIDFGVKAVPTVMAFKDGEHVSEFTGDRADEELTAFLNDILNE